MKTTRRDVLQLTAAAIITTPAPAPAAEADPIFAAIERHRA